MNLLKALTSPTTSNHLLGKQDLEAEASRLVSIIKDLSKQHRKIEYVPEAAKRARYILRKITRLEIQLNCVRSIAERSQGASD